MYSAYYAVARHSRMSVCLYMSITRRYCVETAKHILKLFSPLYTDYQFFNTKRYGNIPTRNLPPLTGASNAGGCE